MKGALVFLIVFAVVLIVTLGAPDIPPGKQIYEGIGAEETDYQILGVEVPTLVSASFNGIVYGVIVWLIYSVLVWAGLFKKKEEIEEYKDITKPT